MERSEFDTTLSDFHLESSSNRSLKNILIKLKKRKWNLKYPTHIFPVKSVEYLILVTTFFVLKAVALKTPAISLIWEKLMLQI